MESLESLRIRAKAVLLFYAWGKVCFDTWDFCLAELRTIVSWGLWPEDAKALVFALYPCYFAWSSASELSRATSPKRHFLLMLVAFAIAGLKGYKQP